MSWDGLANIDRIEPAGNDDAQILEELRAVLERHGALDRFGVTLLHSHFDLEPGEVLVEKVDVANRKLITEPMPEREIDAGQLVPTSWRLDPADGVPVAVINCFRFGDFHAT